MTAPDSSASGRAHGGARVAEAASELQVVIGQLARRFRQDRTIAQPQLAALGWLAREGPSTTSRLATLERIRPQSMAQTVAQMEAAGLVSRRADPSDARQSLIDLTDAGRGTIDQFQMAGASWVAKAIHERFSAAEFAELERGIAMLRRLVDD